MIRNIEFTNIRNKFLDHLNKEIESVRSSKNVLAFADKSTNLYKLSCEKLLHLNPFLVNFFYKIFLQFFSVI